MERKIEMKTYIFIVVFLMLFLSLLSTQEDFEAPGIMRSVTKNNNIRQYELTKSPIWQNFLSEYGTSYTVRWNEKRGIPRTIMGRGIELQVQLNEKNIKKISLQFINSMRDYLQINPEEIRYSKYTKVGGLTHIFFQQFYKGIKVVSAELSITVNKYNRVQCIFSDVFPDIDITTLPSFSLEYCLNMAKGISTFNELQDTEGEKELVIMPVENENGFSYKLAWYMVLHKKRGGPRAFFIDAATGEYLMIRNLLQTYSGNSSRSGTVKDKNSTGSSSISKSENRTNKKSITVSGTVTGKVYPNYPSDALQEYNIKNNYVLIYEYVGEEYVYVDVATTNSSGYYELTDQEEGTYYAKAWLRSPYVKIVNDDAGDAEHTWDLTWCWDGDDINEYSEPSLFYHVNWIHDYFKASPFNLSLLDNIQFEAVVNSDEMESSYNGCNAVYSYLEKKFEFGNGGVYEGFTYTDHAKNRDVIYHEYTHAVVDTIYDNGYMGIRVFGIPESFAMDEAIPDYFASSACNDADHGEGIVTSSDTVSQRELDNDFTMAFWDTVFFSDNAHRRSQILSGALWDLRSSATVTTDEANSIIFNALFEDKHTFLDFRDALFQIDDDLYGDSDLSNGTPHNSEIMNAFANHEIGSALSVSMSGPSSLGYKEEGTYIATVTGGYGSYGYQWKRKYDGGGWTSVGTDTFNVQTMLTTNFTVRVIVLDSATQTIDSTDKYVQYAAKKKGISAETGNIPSGFKLYQNYPNPFNPVTTITFDVPEETDITIKVYNILGEEIVTITQRKYKPGIYNVNWDGRNENGLKVSSGIYIYKMYSGNFVQSRKMLYVR